MTELMWCCLLFTAWSRVVLVETEASREGSEDAQDPSVLITYIFQSLGRVRRRLDQEAPKVPLSHYLFRFSYCFLLQFEGKLSQKKRQLYLKCSK